MLPTQTFAKETTLSASNGGTIVDIPYIGSVNSISITGVGGYATDSQSTFRVGTTWTTTYTVTIKDSAGKVLDTRTIPASGKWFAIGPSSSMVSISGTANYSVDLSNTQGPVYAYISDTQKLAGNAISGTIYYSDKPEISGTNLLAVIAK